MTFCVNLVSEALLSLFACEPLVSSLPLVVIAVLPCLWPTFDSKLLSQLMAMLILGIVSLVCVLVAFDGCLLTLVATVLFSRLCSCGNLDLLLRWLGVILVYPASCSWKSIVFIVIVCACF